LVSKEKNYSGEGLLLEGTLTRSPTALQRNGIETLRINNYTLLFVSLSFLWHIHVVVGAMPTFAATTGTSLKVGITSEHKVSGVRIDVGILLLFAGFPM